MRRTPGAGDECRGGREARLQWWSLESRRRPRAPGWRKQRWSPLVAADGERSLRRACEAEWEIFFRRRRPSGRPTATLPSSLLRIMDSSFIVHNKRRFLVNLV